MCRLFNVGRENWVGFLSKFFSLIRHESFHEGWSRTPQPDESFFPPCRNIPPCIGAVFLAVGGRVSHSGTPAAGTRPRAFVRARREELRETSEAETCKDRRIRIGGAEIACVVFVPSSRVVGTY